MFKLNLISRLENFTWEYEYETEHKYKFSKPSFCALNNHLSQRWYLFYHYYVLVSNRKKWGCGRHHWFEIPFCKWEFHSVNEITFCKWKIPYCEWKYHSINEILFCKRKFHSVNEIPFCKWKFHSVNEIPYCKCTHWVIIILRSKRLLFYSFVSKSFKK